MKNRFVMSVLLVTILSLSFGLLPVNAINNPSSKDFRGVISVSYTAEKDVSPDTVEVSIAVKTSDKSSMQNAAKLNKEISDKVYNYLKSSINISNSDYIKTSNYSARPVYIYQDKKQVFEKYEVSNNIIVHTKSIDKIAKMIDKSLELGATNVDSLNFSLSEKDKFCDELLVKATKESVNRANIVAKAAGAEIDGIKNVGTSCSLNHNQSVRYARNSLMMAKSADSVAEGSSSPIEVGIIKVYSSVNADFYLK